MLQLNLPNESIKLPRSGLDVEIVSFYPYGAAKATQAVMMRGMSIDMKKSMEAARKDKAGEKMSDEEAAGSLKVGDVSLDMLDEILDIKMKMMVVSIGGQKYTDKDAMLNDIHSLPEIDVEAIKTKITEIEDGDTVKLPKDSNSQPNMPEASEAQPATTLPQ